MKRLNLLLFLIPALAIGDEINIPEHIWNSLNSLEQIELTKKHDIRVHSISSYGVLIDVQTLDHSTPGTNAGANLGAAYAQSRYIDNAFRGDSIDYSATKQLGAGVLGAVVGSLLDKPETSKYVTRYTIQLANNNIQIFEETSETRSFTNTNGICVLTNPVRPVNQSMCGMTKEDLLLMSTNGVNINNTNRANSNLTINKVDLKVKCKIGSNAPLIMNKNLCMSANGEIQQ